MFPNDFSSPTKEWKIFAMCEVMTALNKPSTSPAVVFQTERSQSSQTRPPSSAIVTAVNFEKRATKIASTCDNQELSRRLYRVKRKLFLKLVEVTPPDVTTDGVVRTSGATY